MRTYKTELVQASEMRDDDVIIAFMGQTGSGKSQIIDTLTGEPGQRATESFTSVTQGLEAIRILDHERYESRIVLVETPGFNHSSKTDEEILGMIRDWLEKTHEQRILPSGIVYVHRITDPMSSTPRRGFLMFANLTGHKSAKTVVLATTMWDMLGPMSDVGNKREQRLKDEYWKVMTRRGAVIERFLNTSDSAWRLVDNIVKRNNHKPFSQAEWVDQKQVQPLRVTGAGADLDRLTQIQNKEMTKLKGALKNIMPWLSKPSSEILETTNLDCPSAPKSHTKPPVEGVSPEQRTGTLSNEPTKQPPLADGTPDKLSILSTSDMNDKPEHASQPSSPPLHLEEPRDESFTSQNHVDEGDHLTTQDPIPENTPQEDPKLTSKNFSGSTSKNDNPKAKGEEETKTPSETPHIEAKHVKSEELKEEDIVIAVMGPTGSGKSTFISVATGVDAGVGHNLEPCTREIGIIKMTFPHCNIIFVDTPGFDATETEGSDNDILNMISDWLKITFKRKVSLSGLLYFHRISDHRMGRTPLKNLRMSFKELCGQNGFKNVILITTMWDQVDEETGATREEDLKRNYLKSMTDLDSSMGRFERTRDSAFSLIAPLLGTASSRTRIFLLQKELVDLDSRLSEMHESQKLCFEIKQSLMEEYEELKKTSDSLLQRVLVLLKSE